jgi:hypothetical protein
VEKSFPAEEADISDIPLMQDIQRSAELVRIDPAQIVPPKYSDSTCNH